METEHNKIEGIFDVGFVYPEESKINKFIDKVYNINYDSKLWEKEILNFFKETPFAIYYIQRKIIDDYEATNEYIKQVMGISKNHNSVWIIDTEDIYKTIVRIRDSIKINKNSLNKNAEVFLRYSIVFRKMLSKVIDDNDTSFKEFKSILYPSQWELTNSDGTKMYDSLFIMGADSNIDFNYEKASLDIRDKFDKKLKSMIKKETNKSKRKPLDTRLRHEVFKRDNYKCKECGATNKEKTLHADHILPVSQGGCDELSNLQTLCDDCNLAKYNKKFIGGENGATNTN